MTALPDRLAASPGGSADGQPGGFREDAVATAAGRLKAATGLDLPRHRWPVLGQALAGLGPGELALARRGLV